MSEYHACQKCHRALKNPKSREVGFGPVCLKKHNTELREKETEQEAQKAVAIAAES